MLSRKTLGAGLIALVAVGCLGYAGYRVWRHYLAAAPTPAPKTAVVIQAPTDTPPAPSAAPTPVPTLPPSVFIKVPYTSEFPHHNEFENPSDPHLNYCEAAALEMISQYFKGDTRAAIPPNEADAAMGSIVSTERKDYPGLLDLPLTDVAAVGMQLFGLKPTITPVDLNGIESNLAAGRPVIVPIMTGQRLSPYYGAGSVYHVVVITGYDSAKGVLYTNESGFFQGENWPYTWNLLSSAIDAQSAKYPQGRMMLVFDKA